MPENTWNGFEIVSQPSDKDTWNGYEIVKPEPKMSAISSTATGAVSSVLPTSGAWAGAKIAAKGAAKFAASRIASGAAGVAAGEVAGGGPEDPIADIFGIGLGLIGVIGGSTALEKVQDYALKMLPDWVNEKISKAHEDHPVAFDAGSIAASLGGFEMQSPKTLVGGVSDLLHGNMTKAARGVAMGAGLGTAVSVGQPLVTGQPITGEGVAMGVIQSLIAGNPRFSEKHGANTPKASADAAAKIVSEMSPEEKAKVEHIHKTGVEPEVKEALDSMGVPYVLHNDAPVFSKKAEAEVAEAKADAAAETEAPNGADEIFEKGFEEDKKAAEPKIDWELQKRVKELKVTAERRAEIEQMPPDKQKEAVDLENQIAELGFSDKISNKIRYKFTPEERQRAIETRRKAVELNQQAKKTAEELPKAGDLPAQEVKPETPKAETNPAEPSEELKSIHGEIENATEQDHFDSIYKKTMESASLTDDEKLGVEEALNARQELLNEIKRLSDADVSKENDIQGASSRTKEDPDAPAWFDYRDRTIHVSGSIVQHIVNTLRARGHNERYIMNHVKKYIAHEQIHSATPDHAAMDYWNQLSTVEKWAVKKLYYGSGGKSDLYMAREALRMRMQEVLGMKPDELTEIAGTDRLKLDAIYALQKTVRIIRENLIQRGVRGQALATIRAIQINLNHAEKVAASKAATIQGASSRLWSDKSQQERRATVYRQFSNAVDQIRQLAQWDKSNPLEQMKPRVVTAAENSHVYKWNSNTKKWREQDALPFKRKGYTPEVDWDKEDPKGELSDDESDRLFLKNEAIQKKNESLGRKRTIDAGDEYELDGDEILVPAENSKIAGIIANHLPAPDAVDGDFLESLHKGVVEGGMGLNESLNEYSKALQVPDRVAETSKFMDATGDTQFASSRIADFSNPHEKMAREAEESAKEFLAAGDEKAYVALMGQAEQWRKWGDQKTLAGLQNASSRILTPQQEQKKAFLALLKAQGKGNSFGEDTVSKMAESVNFSVKDYVRGAIERIKSGKQSASLTHLARKMEEEFEGKVQTGVLHNMLSQAFWDATESFKGDEIDALLNARLAKDVKKVSPKEAKEIEAGTASRHTSAMERGIYFRGTADAAPPKMTEAQAKELWDSLTPEEQKKEILRQGGTKKDKVLERQDDEFHSAEMRKRMNRRVDLYMQMMEPILKKTEFKREVTPESVSLGEPSSNEPSPITTFYTKHQKDNNYLTRALLDCSVRSKHDPRTASRRVVVLESKGSDWVYVSSVYAGKKGVPMILDPITKGEHLPLDVIKKRYNIRHSILLDEPVHEYSKAYSKYGEFSKKFLQPALELQYKANQYQPPTMSDAEIMQATEGGMRVTKGIFGKTVVDEFGHRVSSDNPKLEEVMRSMRDNSISERKKIIEEINQREAAAKESDKAYEDYLEMGTKDKDYSDRIEAEREIAELEKDPHLEYEGSNVERGSGGSFQGTERSIVDARYGLGRSRFRSLDPLLDYEAGKLYDLAKGKSLAELVQAIKDIKDSKDTVLANAFAKYAKKVNKRWNKIAREVYSSRDPSRSNPKSYKLEGNSLINEVARLLNRAANDTGSRVSFTRRALRDTNGNKISRDPNVKLNKWSSVEHLDTKKELTMPLDRRAPTSVKPENIPQGAPERLPVGAPTKESGPTAPPIEQVPLSLKDWLYMPKESTKLSETPEPLSSKSLSELIGESKSGKPSVSTDIQERLKWLASGKEGELPATKLQLEKLRASSLEERNRKQMASTRIFLEDGIEDVKRITGAYFARRDIKDIQSRLIDAAGNLAANGARDAGWSVRNCFNMAADWLGNIKDSSVKDKMAAINALISSKAVQREFVWTDEAKERATEIINSQRSYRLVAAMKEGSISKTKAILRQMTGEDLSLSSNEWNEQLKELAGQLESGHLDTAHLAAIGSQLSKDLRAGVERMLVNEGLLKFDTAKYSFDESRIHKIDGFIKLVNEGNKKAQKLMLNPAERRKARAWLESNAKLMKELEFAKAHFKDAELQAGTVAAARAFDAAYEIGKKNDYDTKYDYGYIPGRYDAEFFNNDTLQFGQKRLLGQMWTRGAAFNNYYEAASVDAYIPATRDASAMVEHSTRQVMRKVSEKKWQDGWYKVKDEVTGAPIAVPSKTVNGKEMPELPEGVHGSQYVELKGVDGKNIYVLHGFDRLFRQLTEPSAISQWLPTRAALGLSQFLKHTALVGDLFHASRVALYSRAIMGLGVDSYAPGWAALEFSPKNLEAAVRSGAVSPESYKWCMEKVPTNFNGKKGVMTRTELALELQKRGLNVGQIQDAIYKDLVRHWPVLGNYLDKYNKWLFDKMTRGLMTRSAIHEFERISKLDPSGDSHKIAMGVSRDINNMFGSIGRQGWVKSRTWQDVTRMMFLAPQWAEGLVKKDFAVPYKLMTGMHNGGAAKMLKGQETLGRGVARGLVGMAVLTQVLNMITKGKPTWENEDKEHKWDAYLGDGVYLSPLAVYNEMVHDFTRYMETKPKMWDAIQTIGENKLGFYSRAALVLATDKSPTGEYHTTTAGVLGAAAKTILPIPITGRGIGGAAASIIQGQAPTPREYKGLLSVMGLKGEVERGIVTRVQSDARKYVQDNHLKSDTVQISMTDEPSYQKMRFALESGDIKGAKALLDELEKTKGDAAIIKAMTIWEKAPFTGSLKNERLWLSHMTDGERKQYHDAVLERAAQFSRWRDFFMKNKASSRPST
jgi:hypothetical protein